MPRTAQPAQSPAEAFIASRASIEAKLETIRQWLESTQENASPDQITWATVGSCGLVDLALSELVEFVGAKS
jgi:hypothetical protein